MSIGLISIPSKTGGDRDMFYKTSSLFNKTLNWDWKELQGIINTYADLRCAGGEN